MYRAEVVTNHHAGCLTIGNDGEICMSQERTANVRLWDGVDLQINTATCFKHRQQLLQALREAITNYDRETQ